MGLAVVALCAACVAPAAAQVKVGEPGVKPVAYGGVQAWLRVAMERSTSRP